MDGTKVWRTSNAITASSYSDQAFSAVSSAVAGEYNASLWNDYGPTHTSPYNPPRYRAYSASNCFCAGFDVRSVTGASQAGLRVGISPSAKQSTVRMGSYSLIDNGVDGFNMSLFQVTNSSFVETVLTPTTTGLGYGSWHRIDILVEFVNGIAAETYGSTTTHTGNDVVKVYVDGAPVWAGTTWEAYYYENELTESPRPRIQAVNSVLFRLSSPSSNGKSVILPGVQGNGFYFKNVVVSN